ncbi:hypothetical protein TGMAS_203730 [Toxoplasma gondii MAS]|uniref:Uncharacterized protein n=2 Tax=Toxoplasma gondii TaxID=5811 RepID=A0A086PZ54_TOXGO|nr:hypothetical protein TGMAS_203730 [Toxoplasma gondii MAS]PUA89343.1 hypothetical protein TGBR9_203730 [Toxoplasma gondii TgCATBr9]
MRRLVPCRGCASYGNHPTSFGRRLLPSLPTQCFAVGSSPAPPLRDHQWTVPCLCRSPTVWSDEDSTGPGFSVSQIGKKVTLPIQASSVSSGFPVLSPVAANGGSQSPRAFKHCVARVSWRFVSSSSHRRHGLSASEAAPPVSSGSQAAKPSPSSDPLFPSLSSPSYVPCASSWMPSFAVRPRPEFSPLPGMNSSVLPTSPLPPTVSSSSPSPLFTSSSPPSTAYSGPSFPSSPAHAVHSSSSSAASPRPPPSHLVVPVASMSAQHASGPPPPPVFPCPPPVPHFPSSASHAASVGPEAGQHPQATTVSRGTPSRAILSPPVHATRVGSPWSPAGGSRPSLRPTPPPPTHPVAPSLPFYSYRYHPPPEYDEPTSEASTCFHTSLESNGSLYLSGTSSTHLLSGSSSQHAAEELHIQRIHRDVSGRSLSAPVLVGHLYSLASCAVKYTLIASPPASSSFFIPSNSLFARHAPPPSSVAAHEAPSSLISTAGLVAGALCGRIPELEVTDVPPLLDGISVLLLLHQQQIQKGRRKKLEALVAARPDTASPDLPGDKRAEGALEPPAGGVSRGMERGGTTDEAHDAAAGLQLRLVAKVLLDRLEELLHLLRIDEVSRAAWQAACVLPPSVVSPFFFYAVDLRMGDAVCLLASEGLNNPELFDQLLHIRSAKWQASGRLPGNTSAGTGGEDELSEAHGRLAYLARVLHPFAAKPLISKVSFLRSAPMLKVVTHLLEDTNETDPDTLVRLLHLFGNSVQARRLTKLILSRLNVEGDATLPDSVLVDVSIAAGAGELPHQLTSACVRRLLARASQGMHTHALAESVLALAGHLTLEQLFDLAAPLQERAEFLSARQQAALLLLYAQACVAATDLIRVLETHLLASMDTLPVDLFARTALAFSMSTSVSLLTVNKIAQTLQGHALANTISPERLVDVTLALAVAGLQNLRCWEAFGVATRIADFSWKSLPILAWIFAMTDYREISAWQSIALLIPQFATDLSMVQRSQLYEAFTAARLIGFFNVQEQVPELTSRLSSWRRYWIRLRGHSTSGSRGAGRVPASKESADGDEDEKKQNEPLMSPVPYDAIFYVARIQCFQGRETELYTIPFLVPKYNLIFEPLDATPIHQGTGMKLGEVALRHRVWSVMGFNILTVMHSEFHQFFETPSKRKDRQGGEEDKPDDEGAQKPSELQMVLEDGRKFNVGAAANFLTSRIENVARQASTLDSWLSVLKGGPQPQAQTTLPTPACNFSSTSL